MIFIYIQTIHIGKNKLVPYAISLGTDDDLYNKSHLNFRPELVITKRVYNEHKLDRVDIISAPPFCDIADELIELFQGHQLVFTDLEQFKILKSQFKVIGYNFNIKPICLWYKKNGRFPDEVAMHLTKLKQKRNSQLEFAESVIELMAIYETNTAILKERIHIEKPKANLDVSNFKLAPGVYFFLNAAADVIYVGKAKNVRKRLQSHFSNQETSSHIDYSEVHQINVVYTGNDIIAQLVETDEIKSLKPKYNVQQISDAAPFIINKGKTAKGILRLKIIRKDVEDNMPETYFNRNSVKESLKEFCSDYELCRKHCGLESAKGPCTKYTVDGKLCVCSNDESIENYNKRFSLAFQQFQRRKSRKIYKLKGRNREEDAFIYVVNGIYEGYGFIQKDEIIHNANDILGHLNVQSNNYETSRITNNLSQTIAPDNILILE